MKPRSLVMILTLATLLVGARLADAQGATGTVSASYTLLRDTDADRTFSRGISIEATRRIRGWLGVAAEAALSTAHEDFSASQGGTYDFRYQSIQAGPRVTPHTGRVEPYAELLAGVTRLGIWERRLDRTGAWNSPEFSLQPGLGADIFLTRRVALRLGGDLRLLFRHDNRFDTSYRATLLRLNAGLTLRVGRS